MKLMNMKKDTGHTTCSYLQAAMETIRVIAEMMTRRVMTTMRTETMEMMIQEMMRRNSRKRK